MSAVYLLSKRALFGLLAFALSLGAFVALSGLTAPRAEATPGPIMQRPANGVTADGLPTVQIDSGVVWSMDTYGDTVYAGGEFSNVRPAGAAAGTNLTPRGNLVAFSISTGNLVTSFAPSLNGTVKDVKVSPDGSRVYVAGAFTSANGQNRYRLAAFSTATGQLLSTFQPSVNTTLAAIAVTNNTVYAGGWFSQANGVPRTRLAAFRASDGALLAWAPTADNDINGMTMSPDATKVIIGGHFRAVNGSTAWGVASLDAATGALYPFKVNTVVQNAGAQSGIYSLSHDNDTVYGNQYNFGDGNFEGTFAVKPDDGAIKWLDDCHGDTYASFTIGDVVYSAGHPHYCANIGGFPDTSPRIHHPVLGFSKAATGTVNANGQPGTGYGSFPGQPAPSLINYFPDMDSSNYTGQYQNAWSLGGNSSYLVAGGEMVKVNGVTQQGLVRFAVGSKAPKKQGPMVAGADFDPGVLALSSNSVRISWTQNWDRDDQNLTYQVMRADRSTPLTTVSATSQFWTRQPMSFRDDTVTVGSTYRYRVIAKDPDGNAVTSDYVDITVPAGSTLSGYASKVIDDNATSYWRMNDSTGSTLVNFVGPDDLTKGSGVTRAAAGAIGSDSDGAATFNGTSTGTAGGTISQTAPTTFSAEAWIKTTTTRGGKILGFGASKTGASGTYDRHVYMLNDGRLTFGVISSSVKTITSPAAYNDGQWHHIVGELSSQGTMLYVDGVLISNDATTTTAGTYAGFWRVGGDNLAGWTSRPLSDYFAGTVDEVAIYPKALTSSQIRAHYTLSGRALTVTPPADSYGKVVNGDDPALYWRMNEASGTAAIDASANKANGTYAGGVTFGTASNVSGTTGRAVTFNGTTGTIGSNRQFVAPSTYSEEVWFKTTTTSGGKLIGFGNKQSGSSSSYDRHVYLDPAGKVNFGVNAGAAVKITSQASYNDGAWHQVVATQGSAGMRLYVDGVQVATGSQTQALAYVGYVRVGGDTSWAGNPFFAGVLDEAAVYLSVLTPAQVAAHYSASPAAGAVNQAPVASFTAQVTNLSVAFDGSASTDPDGSVASYSWAFGDGATGTGKTATHAYAAAGSYDATLTVTDNRGATSSATKTVKVTAANQAPVAAFTSTPTALKVAFDASTSSDPDGSVSSYAWSFGDGATDSGKAVSHTYAAAGTYSVKLTVTDDQGATGTVTHAVTVSAAAAPVAVDAFGRTVSSGWGTADTGGAWTAVNASTLSVDGTAGKMVLGAGTLAGSSLESVSTSELNMLIDVSADKVATSNGLGVSFQGRKVGSSDYRLKLRLLPGGETHLALSVVVNGSETTLSEVNVASATYAAGDVLRIRFQITGTGTTTFSGKVWKVGASEPAAAQITRSDTTATLQGAGAFGILGYLSGGSTNPPMTVKFDNLSISNTGTP